MTVFIIWLIAFGVILALALKAWDGVLGRTAERWMPAALKSDPVQDRWVVCVALAVLGATFIVKPVSMLLTLILLALILWLGTKLAGWAMHKVKLH